MSQTQTETRKVAAANLAPGDSFLYRAPRTREAATYTVTGFGKRTCGCQRGSAILLVSGGPVNRLQIPNSTLVDVIA